MKINQIIILLFITKHATNYGKIGQLPGKIIIFFPAQHMTLLALIHEYSCFNVLRLWHVYQINALLNFKKVILDQK